jgi:hypothetical protein
MQVVELSDLGGDGCHLLFFDHLVHHAAQLQPDTAYHFPRLMSNQ